MGCYYNLGLIDPSRNEKKPWDIICLSNSDYTDDPVARRSVSGFTLHELGDPMSWGSKAQRNIALSSSEPEQEVSLEASNYYEA